MQRGRPSDLVLSHMFVSEKGYIGYTQLAVFVYTIYTISRMYGMEWKGMERNRMEWYGMGWYGMEWYGMCVYM